MGIPGPALWEHTWNICGLMPTGEVSGTQNAHFGLRFGSLWGVFSCVVLDTIGISHGICIGIGVGIGIGMGSSMSTIQYSTVQYSTVQYSVV